MLHNKDTVIRFLKKNKKYCKKLLPQGDLTVSLGFKNQDELQLTIKSLMEKVLQETPIDKNEGLLQSKEGIKVIPANIELEALEASLIKCLIKKKY